MRIKIERLVRCPECKSTNVVRRVNDDNRLECLDCGHKEPKREDESFGQVTYTHKPKDYAEF